MKGDRQMDKAIAAIEAQQAKEKGRSAPWMVGEQLKDMLRREPESAEIVAQDLTTGGMSLSGAEREIKKYADGHRTGSFACVTPAEAEGILREYFGLGERARGDGPSAPGGRTEGMVSLEDFF